VRELNVDRPIRLDIVTVHDQLLRMRDSDGALYGWHFKVEIFFIVACAPKCCLRYISISAFFLFLQPIFADAEVAVQKSNHRHEHVTW
jgi:hypothetical protein